MSNYYLQEWKHSHDYLLRSGLGNGSKADWSSFGVEPSKVVLSIHGTGISDGLFLWHCLLLALVSGQAPRVVYSQDSLAQYCMRKGDPQQALVTLRGLDSGNFVRHLVERGCVNLRDFTSYKSNWSARTPDGTLNLALPLMGGLMFHHSDLVGNRPLPTLHIQISWTVPFPTKKLSSAAQLARLESKAKAKVRSKSMQNKNPWFSLAAEFNGRKRSRTKRWEEKYGKDGGMEASVSTVSFRPSKEERRLEKFRNDSYARNFLRVGVSKIFPMKK